MEFKDYQKIYEADENRMFYDMVSIVRNGTGVNLVSEVIDNLTNREKDFVVQSSQKYSK